MSLPITTLYVMPLAVIFIALMFNVIFKRTELNTSIGDGGNTELLLRIRKHGNFIEQVPMVLILMILAESQGTGAYWIHAAGALLVLGRISHAIGLDASKTTPLRIAGNMGTILAVVLMVICLARISFGF